MELIPGKLYKVISSSVLMNEYPNGEPIPAKEYGCLLMFLETIKMQGDPHFSEPDIVHRRIFLDENANKVFTFWNEVNLNPEKYLREAIK